MGAYIRDTPLARGWQLRRAPCMDAADPPSTLLLHDRNTAGKSTLMNAIAGQVPASKRVVLRGRVLANGVDVREHRPRIAYVQQKDVFYSQLSVRETLAMAARLRLPRAMSEAERQGRVDNVVSRMGLRACLDSPMGDGLKSGGVSGGERKRVAIACELLSDPSVIFADEPTTGLDAFQADKVMGVLKELASSGVTVLVTIHQPRASIFAQLDDLTLVSALGVAYSGPAEAAVKTLRRHLDADVGDSSFLGAPLNPAEWVVDAISIDVSDADVEHASQARVRALVNAAAQAASPLGAAKKGAAAREASRAFGARMARAGPWTQFRCLFARSLRQVTRDKATIRVRVATLLNSAIVFGMIYWRMGNAQSRIQDRMGLLQVCAINTAMASITKTVTAFTRERAVVSRERVARSYEVGPYFVAKLLAEVPMSALFPFIFSSVVYPCSGLHGRPLRFVKFAVVSTLESVTASALGLAVGAIAPSPEVGNALAPAVMLINIVFGGLYIKADNVPLAFKWLPAVSLVRHCHEALCINEFEGLAFETEGPADLATGEDVLVRFGFRDTSLGRSSLVQTKLSIFYHTAAYIFLSSNKPSFQEMLPIDE